MKIYNFGNDYSLERKFENGQDVGNQIEKETEEAAEREKTKAAEKAKVKKKAQKTDKGKESKTETSV